VPYLQQNVPAYKPPKDEEFDWNQFRGGLNTLLRDTEINGAELSKADNLVLVGSGVPTKAWGTDDYFLSGATCSVRGLFGYYTSSVNELLAITDDGYFNKKSNASYSPIAGASFASGYNAEMVQLNNNVYIANGANKLVKYDSSSLIGFATIAIPSGVSVANLSGASGVGPLQTVSFRVSAENQVGETLASTAFSVASIQEDLTESLLRVSWTAVSAASGVLKGYVIYGYEPGSETYISRVAKDTLNYDYSGTPEPSLIVEPPTADSTGGPVAKYIIRYKDKLVLAGLSGQPTRVLWSGGGANIEKFHWSQGGGYVDIEKDAGDDITGLAVHQEKLIVFKEESIFQLSLTVEEGIVIPVYTLITASHGCVSHRTIKPVENDLFFLSRKGVYVLGYEPNILNVLRTNELSAKIRPTLDAITIDDKQNASAEYFDYKYLLTFPTSKKTIVYDRERLAWMGPWTKPVGFRGLMRYFDSSSQEKLLGMDADDAYVTDIDEVYDDDKGTAIATNLRTKWEDFKSWAFFKTLKDVFTYFRNVQGNVDVSIRTINQNGITENAESYTITSATQQISGGMGIDMLGSIEVGDTLGDGTVETNPDVIRWSHLNKNTRAMQVEVTTDGSSDDYELLGIKGRARVKGKGSLPFDWRT